MAEQTSGYLGAAQIREIAAGLGMRPTKQWGQNFVVDANTVKRIVRRRRCRAGRQRRRGRPRPGLADAGAAARGRPRHRRRGRPDPRRGPARHRATAGPGVRRPADPGARRRHAGARAPRPAADGAGRQPALQRLRARGPHLPGVLPDPGARPRDGAARGRRAARRSPRLQGLRRAERQGRLVCRGAARGDGAPQRVLAGTERRVGPRAARATRPPVDRRHAVETSSRASTRPSPSAARRCAQPSPGWAGSAVRAEECLRAAGIDPRTRGEQLGIEEFAAIASARAALGD